MHNLTRASFAAICALGVTVAVAQTVQQPGAATQVRPPLQTAQAPVAGGAASGASAATAAGAAATATVGAVTFVTFGVVAVAGASGSVSGDATVTHTP